jgi:hypothetical protein
VSNYFFSGNITGWLDMSTFGMVKDLSSVAKDGSNGEESDPSSLVGASFRLRSAPPGQGWD